MKLSVVLITHNEEQNLGRTLASVKPLVAGGQGEIIVVDSGSTDRTVEIAESYGAQVFVEPWKGFAVQKNSALDKASGDWILSLDADEEMAEGAQKFTVDFTSGRLPDRFYEFDGVYFDRRNHFLGRWIRFGGYYPDPKLRLFRRGTGRFEERAVHEDVRLNEGRKAFNPSTDYVEDGEFDIIHHSYPTVSDYIEHMNRYSSLGAEMVVAKGPVHFTAINLTLRPLWTFLYNYIFRLGFLDGKEGFLLHVNHSIYVAWKYAKAWELASSKDQKL